MLELWRWDRRQVDPGRSVGLCMVMVDRFVAVSNDEISRYAGVEKMMQ